MPETCGPIDCFIHKKKSVDSVQREQAFRQCSVITEHPKLLLRTLFFPPGLQASSHSQEGNWLIWLNCECGLESLFVSMCNELANIYQQGSAQDPSKMDGFIVLNIVAISTPFKYLNLSLRMDLLFQLLTHQAVVKTSVSHNIFLLLLAQPYLSFLMSPDVPFWMKIHNIFNDMLNCFW